VCNHLASLKKSSEAGVIGRKPKSFFSPHDPSAVRTRFRKVLARAERRIERELRQMTKSKPADTMVRLTLRPNRPA
jgi:hypothetical protein